MVVKYNEPVPADAELEPEMPPQRIPGDAYRRAFLRGPEPLVLLSEGTVADLNEAARDLLSRPQNLLIGLPEADLPRPFTFDEPLGDGLRLIGLPTQSESPLLSTLRLVANSVPALLSYIDSQYRFRFANVRYSQWFGWSPLDMIGRHIADVIGADAFESVKPYVATVLGGEPVTYQRLMPYTTGGERTVESTLIPDFAPNGNVRGFVAHIVDVTLRVHAEDALRKSEARFRFLAESSPEYVWTSDPSGRLDYVNERWLNFVGLTMEEAYHEGWRATLHPADLNRTLRTWMEGVRTGNDVSMEHRLRAKDGSYRWLRSRATAMRDDGGEIVKWFGVSTDIHDLKLAEQRFRQTVEQSPFSTQIMDPSGRILLTNPAWERLWGLTLDMLEDYCILEDEEVVRQGVMPFVQRAFDGEPVEIPAIGYRPDRGEYEGQPRWVRSYIYPVLDDGEVREVVQLHEDVSDEVNAEQAVRESEERYRSLVLATSAIVWSTPATGVFTTDQPGWSAFTGQTTGQLMDKGWLDAIHPDDRRHTLEAWERCLVSKRLFEVEHRLRRQDGEYRDMHVRAVPILNRDGSTREWVGVHVDITEVKGAQRERERLIAELETERGRLREIFARAPALIACLTLPDFRFEVANDRFLRFVGKSDVLGKTVSEVLPELIGQGFLSQLDAVVKTGQPFMGKAVPVTFGGGAKRYIDFVYQPIRNAEGVVTGVFAHGVDVTEQAIAREAIERMNVELEQRVEERTRELREANEEMEGFTYTVSHDLRAPLRAIHSTSRILEDDFSEALPEEAREQIRRQGAAARRMGVLIDELLKLSRISRMDLQRETVSLSGMAEELVAEYGRRAGSGLRFEVQPSIQANGDPRLLRFVLQNLIENAIKFSPAGGTIRFGQNDEGTYFLADEGIGFDMQYANKLFLPFERLVLEKDFPGTGIGLANVHRIVKRHGGHAWAEAELGKGATFYFTLCARP